MFQFIREEADALTSQIAISKPGRGRRRTLPYAFTEHAALMAANILRSERAVEMSVYVVRAFIRQRERLAASAETLRKLESIDDRLLQHDQALVIVWEKIKGLMRPTSPGPPPNRNRASASNQ